MTEPVPFKVGSERHGAAVRLIVSGELDLASVPLLERETSAALEQPLQRLVIDLGELAFVDSSGLRFFVALNDRATREGWSLELVRPAAPALTVFQISGAEENLPFVEAGQA
jgi:anti-anti-sigma factor